MDLTPKFAKMDFSDDSGFITASITETSSSSFIETSPSTSHPIQATPIKNVTTRKRKIPPQLPKKSKTFDEIYRIDSANENFNMDEKYRIREHFNSFENLTFNQSVNKSHILTPSTDQSKTSPWICFPQSNFFSSTLNESVEEIIFKSLTPNFYMERDETCSPRKQKRSDKSYSAPSTPPHSSLSTPLNQNEKINLDGYKTTPVKIPSTLKLGSPERNEILYPGIKCFEIPYKPKTPQKFFENIKRYSPAKKRLFGVDKVVTLDPVKFFLNDKKQYPNVIKKILSFLSDDDLYNFKLVSKRWKDALQADKVALRRLDLYTNRINFNKENCVRRKVLDYDCDNSSIVKKPLSPKSKTFHTFFELAKTLKEGQTLNKCPLCNYAAIIDKNISQCQRYTCGYIHCVSCLSFSKTGPENFSDKCQQATLIFETPKSKSNSSYGIEEDDYTDWESPSFSFGAPKFNSSAINETPELKYLIKASLNKSAGGVLQDCNRDLFEKKVNEKRRSSLAVVVPLNKTKEEDVEPSSPPKIKNVAFSKQSKRNLKRLLR